MQNGFHDIKQQQQQQYSSSHDNELNWLDLVTTSPIATAMLDSNIGGVQDDLKLTNQKLMSVTAGSNGVDHNFNLDLGVASPIAEDFVVQSDVSNPQWEWEGFLNTNFSTWEGDDVRISVIYARMYNVKDVAETCRNVLNCNNNDGC